MARPRKPGAIAPGAVGSRAKKRASPSAMPSPVMPSFIAPSLCTAAAAPPAGDEWLNEIKYDGYRLQAHVAGGGVRLLTRKGLDWTGRFGALSAELAGLACASAIIDGEVVVEDDGHVSRFSRLVAELKAGRSAAMIYWAFDLMHLDGRSLVDTPLGERKRLLRDLLAASGERCAVRYADDVRGRGPDVLAGAARLGLEGIVSKRIDQPYRSGRVSGGWIKVKCRLADEFVVAGYVPSTASREIIGSLVLGFWAGDRFVYAGRVGTGFSLRTAGDLWQALQPLRRDRAPFAVALDAAQRRGVVWVEPRLVAHVTYEGRTADDLLWHAVFQELRDDKPAREVTASGFAATAAATAGGGEDER